MNKLKADELTTNTKHIMIWKEGYILLNHSLFSLRVYIIGIYVDIQIRRLDQIICSGLELARNCTTQVMSTV